MNDWNTSFAAACQLILNAPKTSEYAKAYAKVGMKLANGWIPRHLEGCPQDELLRVQALYILNNIQHWREPPASSVRKTLKAMVKE